jgi:uncharacterized protein involved in exopolysaccharide biosynthesis
MSSMLRQRKNEVDVGSNEATEAKIDALGDRLDDMKEDARGLRADVNSLRDKLDKYYGEMHAGFAALRESIVGVQTGVQTNITSLQANVQASITSLQASVQTSITSLQGSVASLQASVAELRATMKTMFWAIGIVGMLATIFLTAAKVLHWF